MSGSPTAWEYTEQTRRLYISEIEKFIKFLPDDVVYISDLTTFHINKDLFDPG